MSREVTELFLRNCKPGMKVAEDIKNEYGNILIKENNNLKERHLQKLKNYNIDNIKIYEEVKEKKIEELPEKPYDFEIKDLLVKLLKKIGHNFRVGEIIMPHQWRVMFMVALLCNAEDTDIVDEDTDNTNIIKAAFLHDVGKLGMNSRIILKKGKLSKFEYELIKGHSHVGNRIIRKIVNKPVIAKYVRDHHERVDGKGYPRGLEKENISYGGRLISVIDTFDAIVLEKRPYKKDLDIEDGLRILSKVKGEQLESKFVEDFIKLWEEEILNKKLVRTEEAKLLSLYEKYEFQ